MRIVLVEIEHFRGIESLRWTPATGMNCLIGPGDSTKTSILDAIELCLNPRPYTLADDCDFHNLDTSKVVRITVTLADLPTEFLTEDRYGMQVRGWNAATAAVEDEPADGLDYAISLRVTIDASLEARWSIFNDRMSASESDPPSLRYKDAKRFAINRLGPYAERHLAWGRSSVLNRLGVSSESVSLQLAEASRAARKTFSDASPGLFDGITKRAEGLSKLFSVPVREKYIAALDAKGLNMAAGGISLHDGPLPLRMLGTGSSRLIVSALQHEVGPEHISVIDEIEFGLEPHRIARLLTFLKPKKPDTPQAQVFITTHSPVVIRELSAEDIFAVRSVKGSTQVQSILAAVGKLDTAQRYLRGTPEAFLARRIVVGEGKTEQGIARGLDAWWADKGMESFALQGVVAIDGNGKDNAPQLAEHLLDLGYEVLLLLDSDEPPNPAALQRAQSKGAVFLQWPDICSTEERLFRDLPWQGVQKAVAYACECGNADSVLALLNNTLKANQLDILADLTLSASLDSLAFRTALGKTAKKESWYKDIAKGEGLGEIIAPYLSAISGTPLAKMISELRRWIDG